MQAWTKNIYCKDCGTEVVFTTQLPESDDFDEKFDCADYYAYCGNPNCKNHVSGEGIADDQEPSFGAHIERSPMCPTPVLMRPKIAINEVIPGYLQKITEGSCK